MYLCLCSHLVLILCVMRAGGSGGLGEPCREDPKAVDLRASYRPEKKKLSSRVSRDLLFSMGSCLQAPVRQEIADFDLCVPLASSLRRSSGHFDLKFVISKVSGSHQHDRLTH